jgi:hypothetical protein
MAMIFSPPDNNCRTPAFRKKRELWVYHQTLCHYFVFYDEVPETSVGRASLKTEKK